MTAGRVSTPIEELLTDDPKVPASTVDLRGGFHRLGGFDGGRPPAVTPRRRIRILRPDIWTPTGPRLTVHGAVDGIQTLRVGVYRDRRPVMVAYASAGCLEARGLKLTCLTQRLFAIASYLDEHEIRRAFPDIPAIIVDEIWPDAITARAGEILDTVRRHVETITASAVRPPEGSSVLLDGDLRNARPDTTAVVGVVKDTSTPYADIDPEPLELGQCSAVIELQPEKRGQRPRYTCYTRIGPSGPASPEGVSLVRLETFDPELLGPLALACRGNALAPGQPNSRSGSHLKIMALTEERLRAAGAGIVLI